MRKLITAIALASLLLPAASIAIFAADAGKGAAPAPAETAPAAPANTGPVDAAQGHRLGDTNETSR